MALARRNRLIEKRDFDGLLKEGKAVKGSFLFLKFRDNKKGLLRFGFIISKKSTPKAVDRNRLKRILSDVAAIYIKDNPEVGRDIAVIIRNMGKDVLIKEDINKVLKLLRP